MSPRTREDARLARAYIVAAGNVSPDVAREFVELRRSQAEARAASAKSDDDRRYAAALRYAADEAESALRDLAGAR